MFLCAFLAKQIILDRMDAMNLCTRRECHCLCVVDSVQMCHVIGTSIACVDCGIEIIHDLCNFTPIQIFSDIPHFSVDGIFHQVPKAERKTFAFRDSNL